MSMKTEWMAIVLATTALIFAVLSLILGFALRAAQADRQEALDDATHWRQVASKAYTGYLLATSPASPDGLIRQIAIPKGSKRQGGMLLPPDDFCAKGILQCNQTK